MSASIRPVTPLVGDVATPPIADVQSWLDGVDATALGGIDVAEQVVRHAGHVLRGGAGGQDPQFPVDLHGIGVDHHTAKCTCDGGGGFGSGVFDQLNREDAGLPLEEKHGCTVLLAVRDWHYQGFAPYRRAPRVRQGAVIGKSTK